MIDLLRVASGAILLLSALVAAEWAVAYQRLTGGDWRRSSMGRHVMVFMAVLGTVCAVFAARFVVVTVLDHDDTLWFRAVRLAVLAAVPAVLIWRRILLSRAQRERRS